MTEPKHEGLPVAGYRPQATEAVQLVNANKMLEEIILRTLDDLAAIAEVDKRWLAIGRTQIEQGFMAMNRAIFKPDRVTLPDDPPLTKTQAEMVKRVLGLSEDPANEQKAGGRPDDLGQRGERLDGKG